MEMAEHYHPRLRVDINDREVRVALTRTQLGGIEADPGQAVTVSSNGTPVEGDPNRLRLRPEQQIEVRLG